MQRGNPRELNFEGLKMQKRNILTNRAQRVDEKKVVICLVVMFIPRVIAIKTSKIALFCIFADSSKKTVIVLEKYIIVSGSPTKTVYMEKYHPTLVRSHLR